MWKHNNKDNFKFYVPVKFEKGGDGNSKYLMKIKGIASSKTEDSDGEILDPAGFTFDKFLKSGIINWNHNASKTSAAVCGRPTKAAVINNGRDFYIEGVIFNNTEGRAVAELLETLQDEPGLQLGWSIEGKATGRDMMDSRKITKATIHGVALTHLPKNGNTWVDIVKGQYSDLNPEENEEEESDEKDKKSDAKEEKAMDTGNTGMLAPEHVEHGEKPKQGLKILTKAQIYESIIDKYDLYDGNFVLIKNIYNFVKSVNDKYMAVEQISQDTLEKAFSILDAITKGEGANTEEKAEDTPVEKSEQSATIEAKEDIKKGMDDEAFEMAKSMYGEGKSKEECIEGMVRKGLSLATSQTAVESVIAQAAALKENGGTIESQAAPIVKAEDVAKLVLDDISKALNDNIAKSIDPLAENIKKGFGAVNELFKSQEKENDILKSQLAELTERLGKVEKTPIPSKSARNVIQLEKFNKSENSGELGEGWRQVSVSDKIEKGIVLDQLEANFDAANTNTEKELWGKAMRDVEAVGLAALQISPNILNKLKINLVQ